MTTTTRPDRSAEHENVCHDVAYLTTRAVALCWNRADPKQVKRLQTYLVKWLHDQEKGDDEA